MEVERKAAVRLGWDAYFMGIADAVAKRSTCPRAPGGGIGCVLTRGVAMVGSGYVGSVRGEPHCTDVGCLQDPLVPGCTRTVHAEQNALLAATTSLAGHTAYTTLSPCWTCMKLLVQSGITRIVYSAEYRTGVGPQKALALRSGCVFEQLAVCPQADKTIF